MTGQKTDNVKSVFVIGSLITKSIKKHRSISAKLATM